MMDQISEGGRSIHEIDKIRKRLEAEKMELQSALEEAEATLEQGENKVLRCQLELNAVRQEIERRLSEKEEEFILVKKAQSKALDSMQVALETETKSKAEALRMKKKLEGDAADLGLALEHAIAGNAETQTTIKKYALQVRDAQVKVDEESAAKSAAADAKVTADRRAAAVANGLEEAVLFLRLPTASAVLLSRSSLTPTRLWLTSPTSTSPSASPRGSLRVSLASSTLTLTR